MIVLTSFLFEKFPKWFQTTAITSRWGVVGGRKGRHEKEAKSFCSPHTRKAWMDTQGMYTFLLLEAKGHSTVSSSPSRSLLSRRLMGSLCFTWLEAFLIGKKITSFPVPSTSGPHHVNIQTRSAATASHQATPCRNSSFEVRASKVLRHLAWKFKCEGYQRLHGMCRT